MCVNKPEMTLRVPGQREYALVLRLALGGVAILKDLDAGALDDLRNASDEACDCLLHQGRKAQWLELTVYDEGARLRVCLAACFGEDECAAVEDETDITRAVLETLVPEVTIEQAECGCVGRIGLALPKAVAMGA